MIHEVISNELIINTIPISIKTEHITNNFPDAI